MGYSSRMSTEIVRCSWVGSDPQMIAYHDEEWGTPVRDSRDLWAKLMLDGFQAGLSWSLILKRRDVIRASFADFDPMKVAAFGEKEIEAMLANPQMIRSRSKIQSTITGAQRYLDMMEKGEDFATWCWSFTEGQTLYRTTEEMPAKTPLSEQISKELKARGFKFVGPVIVYAWMQAVGLVNDHDAGCFRRNA